MLQAGPDIQATRDGFAWDIPQRYNIGVDICDRVATRQPDAPAIIDVAGDGRFTTHSFADLRRFSNQIANVLAADVTIGDRVAILLPQSFETAASHIAALKMGAVTLPLFTQFGPEALLHRLRDSETSVIVTNRQGAAALRGLRAQLPHLKRVLTIDGPAPGCDDLHAACATRSPLLTPVDTAADDPAILIYTSGTTGAPKGALHAHRVLLGHLPGVEMSHDFFPQPGDRFWTPADWAWIGGLLDVLMPALHHGVAVVARRFGKFSASAAFDLIDQHKVRNVFLPPTALKMMRQDRDISGRKLPLRSVASGGETLGSALIDWGRDTFGVTINEFYGQTECNMIVSSCAALAPAEPGVMGFAVPGHIVAVIDADTGCAVPSGEIGNIAVLSPDPVMFLRYWNNPAATAKKFVSGPAGTWLLTGDKGMTMRSGRIKFIGRDDDVISSAGYRIGPGEIEDCLLGHPAVAIAGVVGAPDPTRGQIVAAFVKLTPDHHASDELAGDIAAHVKARLASYEYPRIVRFVDNMPMTTTGKVIRNALRDMLSNEGPHRTVS